MVVVVAGISGPAADVLQHEEDLVLAGIQGRP